jgi:hypothetical protein
MATIEQGICERAHFELDYRAAHPDGTIKYIHAFEVESRKDRQNDIDAPTGCADDQSELGEAVAAVAEPDITPASISAREAELAAIARFEAEHGVTTCPAPGSAELAALPMLSRAYMGRKWGRSEN